MKILELPIYHITDVANLKAIVEDGGLHCDATMQTREYEGIGYNNIKERRLKEIRVPCCGNRFVGEFVPFYYCPRSPMLFTINKGNTGRPVGCQTSIVHMVSSVGFAVDLNRQWAVSDGNAGAYHTSFYGELDAIRSLDWSAINANSWGGRQHQKHAEFLVESFFPLSGFTEIGCHGPNTAAQVAKILGSTYKPLISTRPQWYY